MTELVRRRRRLAVKGARLLAAAAACGLLLWWVIPWLVPLPQGVLRPAQPSPRLLDRDGREIAGFPDADWLRRRPLDPGAMPPDLVAATLAAEDKRFFRHGGIDLLATARAVLDAATSGRLVSGASTISQQLVKVSRPPVRRGVPTKLYEMLAARQLEMRRSKEEILAAYLNRVDYGNLRQGAAEAADFYFQKPLDDLSLAECALLAGLPQAPSRLDPLRHPERALTRRDVVLDRLERNGFARDRVAAARSESLRLRPLASPIPAPHLLAALRAEAAQRGTVATTLSLPLQQAAEAIVEEELARLADRHARHASVVVIDNASGGVLALVGSAGIDRPAGQLNGAVVPRSAGSTLKPFTYLLCFESLGDFPGTVLPDIPTEWRTAEGLDAPRNYDGRHRGPVTVRNALANSLNIPAMHALNRLGGPRPLAEFLAAFGIGIDPRDAGKLGLGLTIGNAEVRLLDLAGAYSAIARLGTVIPPTFLRAETPNARHAAEASVASPESCWLIADILSDNAARAPSFGIASPLRLPFRCAVKTGTSSDFRDNWCIGFTRSFTVGVWVGNFDNTPMDGISGVDGSGPIFQRVMMRAHEDRPPDWPARPGGIIQVAIDPRSGHRLGSSDDGAPDSTPETNRLEWCRHDRLPPPASPGDYDGSQRIVLDGDYRDWFESAANARRHLFAMAPDRVPESVPRIIQPADRATYLLDPELPSGGSTLQLISDHPGRIQWECASLAVNGDTLHLEPGEHVVRATDPMTGRSATATIRVRTL